MTQQPVATSDKLDAAVLKVAGVVVLGAIMSILDVTVVSVALPTFQSEFGASYARVAWTMTGYTLALATVIPLSGWAADRFGTKRLYMVALALFTIGSALCATADTIETADRLPRAPGTRRRHAHAAGHDDHDQGGRAAPDRPADGRPRHPDAARPDRRPDPRRLADRHGELALDLPDQPADRRRRAVYALLALPKDNPEPSESFDFLGMLMLSPGLAAVPLRRLLAARGRHVRRR